MEGESEVFACYFLLRVVECISGQRLQYYLIESYHIQSISVYIHASYGKRLQERVFHIHIVLGNQIEHKPVVQIRIDRPKRDRQLMSRRYVLNVLRWLELALLSSHQNLLRHFERYSWKVHRLYGRV